MKSVKPSLVASAIGLALLGAGAMGTTQAANPLLSVESASLDHHALVESQTGRYIVTFAEPGLAQYRGGVPGLARTAPGVDGVSLVSSRKLEMDSEPARAYQSYLAQQRDAHMGTLQSALGRSLDPHFTYEVTRNGVSLSLDFEEAQRVAQLPGVVSVVPVDLLETQTFRGPSFIGADSIWNGSAVPLRSFASRGEGIKVGIIDTGTFIGHPSFTNDASCGFSEASPKLHPRDCTSNSGGTCTGTLPNADVSSHGVHTSSTAAGNTIDNTASPAPLLPDGITMSGVAPCASIYSYNVANHTDGTLANDALEAAVQNAIVDQVDVINYSIGITCGGGNPWGDQRMGSFLTAAESDVFIAASAGNTRDTCTDPVGRVGNNAPWILTVANSTQDEVLAPTLSVTAPGPVPALLEDIALTPGSTTLAPADTVDLIGSQLHVPANFEACTASGGVSETYDADDIVIVRRGTCAFSEKIINAYGAGARTVIVANNQAGTISMDTTGAPADVASFSISSQTVGDALLAFIANPPSDFIFADGFEDEATSGAAVFGDYQRSSILARQGDVISGGSLRGPTAGAYKNLTKPDITGPGTDIFAAFMESDGNYGLMSGTSMSSPHLAGAGALVRSIHPEWTPYEVKSALQTTASRGGFMEDGVTPGTPDVVGSGRVDLTRAALAGLTLDETGANFQAANPNGGSIDQTQLNVASLRNVECGTSCSWTRTVTNRMRGPGSHTWDVSVENPSGYTLSVSPANFTLDRNQSQVITITATADAGATQALSFGAVVLEESTGTSPDQHFTVAIKGETPLAPPGFCENGVCTLKVDELVSAISGLGCNAYCGMVWLNQFSPPAGEYPITLNAVQTIFGAGAGWNAAGDLIQIYIYLDDDNDPSNGATLLHQQTYTQLAPANSWRNIALSAPVTINGPGHILIAMTNPVGNVGTRPAIMDGGPSNTLSWIGDYQDTATGVAPNLADPAVDLILLEDLPIDRNLIIRATGTNGGGRPVTLEPVTR